VAKYLDVLTMGGRVEMKQFGPAKVFVLSHHVPLKALLNFSNLMLLVVDQHYIIKQVNQNYVNLDSNQPEDLIEHRIDDDHIPWDPSLMLHLDDALNGKGSNHLVKLIVESSERHFRLRFVPHKFDDKTPGVTILMEDETEQVSARAEVESIAKLANASPYPVLRIQNGQVIYANKASTAILDQSGTKEGAQVPEQWLEYLQLAEETDETVDFDFHIDDVEMRFTAVPMKDDGFIQLYGFDTTRLKNLGRSG